MGKYKQAGISDIFIAIILSFILIVCLVLFTYAANMINTKITEKVPMMEESFAEDVNVTDIVERTVGETAMSFDSLKWISFMLICGYFLCILLAAFLVKTHPAWFMAYVLILIIAVIAAAEISNVYQTLKATPALASTWSQFTLTNLVFQYFPIWVAVIGIIAAILMYINLDWGSSYV